MPVLTGKLLRNPGELRRSFPHQKGFFSKLIHAHNPHYGYPSAINMLVQVSLNSWNAKVSKRRFFGQFDHH